MACRTVISICVIGVICAAFCICDLRYRRHLRPHLAFEIGVICVICGCV